MEPTAAQIESRQEVDTFLSRMKAAKRGLRSIKSAWFGRPEEELKGWIERGKALEEIENSRGYQLIMWQTDREIAWAQKELETCGADALLELRCYLKTLRFFKNFILETKQGAENSSKVLSGRSLTIQQDADKFLATVTPGQEMPRRNE